MFCKHLCFPYPELLALFIYKHNYNSMFNDQNQNHANNCFRVLDDTDGKSNQEMQPSQRGKSRVHQQQEERTFSVVTLS